MMPILFLSVMNGGAWGGSEEQWFKTALYMRSIGHDVTVMVFEWKEKKGRLNILRDAGISVKEIPNGRGFISVIRRKRFLAKTDFSKYHFVYVNQGGWHDVTHGAFKNLYKRLPAYAMSFHNYQLNSHQKASRITCLAEWIKNSSVTIAATGVIYEMLEREFGIAARNPVVFYSPITFSPPPAPLPFPENEVFTFITLGALDTSRKAQNLLIEALGGPQWKTRKWKLEIYGEGKDEQMLKSIIQLYQLEANVFLKGHTSSPAESLMKAHIMLQATRYDAMPISVMEAMSIGRPCLVSDVGDMPVWIKHNENGFMVTALNKKVLEEILEEVWHNRIRIDILGREAFNTFQELYPQPYEEKFTTMLLSYFPAL